MYPSASTMYLTSSSPTCEVFTATNDCSCSIRGLSRSRISGANTTSPLSHNIPPGALCRRARRRLFEVLVLRSEEHTSELQSRGHLVCRLLLEKKTIKTITVDNTMQ